MVLENQEGEDGTLQCSNGDRGIVKHINNEDEVIKVVLDSGNTVKIHKKTWHQNASVYDEATDTVKTHSVGTFTQYPLKLASAVSITKSQGQVFDRVFMQLDDQAISPHGQVYRALSHCRSLQGITLSRPLSLADIAVDPSIVDFYKLAEIIHLTL
jgi:ATP-dependent DNA helicase PIF1